MLMINDRSLLYYSCYPQLPLEMLSKMHGSAIMCTLERSLKTAILLVELSCSYIAGALGVSNLQKQQPSSDMAHIMASTASLGAFDLET